VAAGCAAAARRDLRALLRARTAAAESPHPPLSRLVQHVTRFLRIAEAANE
jgi:hypothetical protein